MFALMGTDSSGSSLWRNMGSRFKRNHFIGTVLIFTVFTGLAFFAGRNGRIFFGTVIS